MIWFKDRKKLDDLYKEWVKENNVADESFNVITFLVIKDLIDEEKLEKLLGSDSNE